MGVSQSSIRCSIRTKTKQQTDAEQKRQDDIAMGRTTTNDTYGGIQQQNDTRIRNMEYYKNTLGKMTQQERDAFLSKKAKESNFNWDLMVDLISAACELVPGLGTALSFGIDVIHAIVNLMQGLDSWASTFSVEKIIDGLVGLLLSVFPGIGNAIKMTMSAIAKKIIKDSVKLMEKLALGNLDFFSKLIWVLLKRAGEETGIDNVISVVTEKLQGVTNDFKDWSSISGPLNSVLEILNPLVPFATTPLPIEFKNIK